MTILYIVPAADAAGNQLDWAIRLLLDHQAFLPSITLAGASRGMIEALLGKDPIKVTAYSSIKDALAKKGYGTPDGIGKALNGPRNYLKHADDEALDPYSADLQSMAIAEVILATLSLYRFDHSVVSEWQRFYDWIKINCPDLGSGMEDLTIARPR